MPSSLAFAALACLPAVPQEFAQVDVSGTVTFVAPGLTGDFASHSPADTLWGELQVDLAEAPVQLPAGALGYRTTPARTRMIVGGEFLSGLPSMPYELIRIADGSGGAPDSLTYEHGFTYWNGSMNVPGMLALSFVDIEGDAWASAILESLPTPLVPDAAAGQVATLSLTDAGGTLMIEARIDVFGFDTSFESHCYPVLNSTGRPGRLTGMGSRVFGDNNFSIFADHLPMGSFGLFITSPNEGFVANPGGNYGNLCLSGPIGRFIGPGQVMNSGTSGTMHFPVDLSNLPTPFAFESAAAGETRYFQLWHRDLATGTVWSNFTNSLAITLQ